MTRLNSFRSHLVAGVCLAAAAPLVAAQQNDSQRSQSDNLEVIVVTAQRRAEQLQDVPLAVTQLSASDLLSSNIVSITEIAARVPGVAIQNGGTGTGQPV